jgi:alkanesulfonate monooxygenase SsuD/methylene tetrahydromethanopterin reductase-like flavin-dependent oxidoreductase (luciferase family)
MSATGAVVAERLSVRGIELELVRRGAGRPVLLLHGPQTVDPRARFLDLLGRRAEILAPSHPGFGHSPRPADFETVYDLVRLYLEVLYRTAPGPSADARDEAARPANAEKPIASASQNAATLIGMTAEQAMARGILSVGNPDTVYRQIMDFYDRVGGFGHLVLVGRMGFMTHAEAEKGIKLFSKEVMPRLREIAPVTVG